MIKPFVLAFALLFPRAAPAQDQVALTAAARAQVGVTLLYDPSYVTLEFPGGDVPEDRGVCTDVIIRAFRKAWGIDLQQAINRDMKANFAAYPANWGLAKTDRNIDHRRVPNLQTLLVRVGADLPLSTDPADFHPGDLVTYRLPGNLPHIALVSDQFGTSAPLILHNIGRGAQEEDALFAWQMTGHYRISADAFDQLNLLGG